MKHWLGIRCLLVYTVGFCLVLSAYGSEIPKKQQVWYFGEGLKAGDEFTFEICDPILRIPEIGDHCYTITMRFFALLPTHEGMTWIVATHIDHKVKTEMIFQISQESFKIKTDGTNVAYANSIERTVGWIRQFAAENKPQILSVGKLWGTVKGDSNWPTQISVERTDFGELGNAEQTYLLGYSFLKESQIQIKDGFPFPLKATIYKPISSHQDTPIDFSFQIISYQNVDNNMCQYVSPSESLNIASLPKQKSQSFNDLLHSSQQDDYFHNHNYTDIEEFTIDEMLKRTNDNSTVQDMLESTYDDRYREKLRQSVYNFTKFVEMIANASNTILQSQLGHPNASFSN